MKPNDPPESPNPALPDDQDVTRPTEPEPPASTPNPPSPADLGEDDLDTTSVLNEPTEPASDFMSEPSDALFGAAGARPPEAVGELLQLGKYALIGSPDPTSSKPYIEGGEGRLYLAQALDGGPKVALKMPLPRFANDEIHCKRLVKEGQQLQSMNHPAIVKVIEIDDEHEPPYYTMEYLSGGPLSKRMKEVGGAFDLEEVLRLTIPLADAVRYVHDQKGVSHRDIKPHNVLLNDKGEAVFVDFGLSRDNTGDEATITPQGPKTNRFKVGTAMYMAPELFDGKAGSAPTDIYAFGVMLYELATGQRPYDASDYDTLNKKKRLEDPRDPAAVHPDIDPRLARVISHALARRAKDRYATMEDLHEDLQAIRDGEQPIHAPGPGMSASDSVGEPLPYESSDAGRKPGRLLRVAVLLLVLGVAGTGLGVGIAQWGGDETDGSGGDVVVVTDDVVEPNPLDSTPDTPDADRDQDEPHDPEPAGGDPDPVRPILAGGSTEPPGGADNRGEAPKPNPSNGKETIGDAGEKPLPGNSTTPDQTIPPDQKAPPENTPPPAPPADPLTAMTGQITAELFKTAPRDAAAAEQLGKLADSVAGTPNAKVSEAHKAWLHRAAQMGLAESLAVLITRADDFGNSANVTLDNGYTWLHSAIESAETDEFAAGFADWMRKHEIDPKILNHAPPGMRSPGKFADFHKREVWQAALREAAEDAEVIFRI